MFSTDTTIRVRYAETDQMGYVYYGNYAAYFEVARTEAFRQLGISLQGPGSQWYRHAGGGAGNPVSPPRPLRRPAHGAPADARNPPAGPACCSSTKCTTRPSELLTEGHTLMVFMRSATGRPVPVPAEVIEKLAPYFAEG